MILRFDHVNYVYDADGGQPVHALSDINLTIGEGEFIGLIGHTGSGKSTLIQHADGLLKPVSGRILADGEDIWEEKFNRKALRARVGLVFQYPEHQLFEEDILSDVCYGPMNLGCSAEEARERAVSALRQVGIGEDLFGQSPFDLSGGQKRRTAIAGVLAMQPEILILDEPTAGLDPRGRDEILALARTLHEERNITVVLVSHSMEDIARFAKRLLVLGDGRLVFDGPTGEVFSHRAELEEMGLEIPRPQRLLEALKEHGFPEIGTGAYTAEEAARLILRELEKR